MIARMIAFWRQCVRAQRLANDARMRWFGIR
jgi:hypothetical protein